MERIAILRELSEHLRNLAIHTHEKADAYVNDDTEHAFMLGTSRGYMMASRILSVRAADIEGELMEHIVNQSRELEPRRDLDSIIG